MKGWFKKKSIGSGNGRKVSSWISDKLSSIKDFKLGIFKFDGTFRCQKVHGFYLSRAEVPELDLHYLAPG